MREKSFYSVYFVLYMSLVPGCHVNFVIFKHCCQALFLFSLHWNDYFRFPNPSASNKYPLLSLSCHLCVQFKVCGVSIYVVLFSSKLFCREL